MTATETRALVRAAVEAHGTHNTFYSNWTSKDEVTEPKYPFVEWHDWHNRPQEDEMGFLHRAQFVQLFIVTCPPTDRTPEERDAAVEDADRAALDIIMRLRQSRTIEVRNVNITTRWDERQYLATGVLLQFTLWDKVALCYDETRFTS